MNDCSFIAGQSWVKALPAGWAGMSAKRIFDQSKQRSETNDEQLSVTQKQGVVRQNDLLDSGQKVVLALSGTDSFKHVDINDFVISLRSFQGGIEWSKVSGCVSPAYTVLRASRPIAPGYWGYLFKSTAFINALRSVIDEGIRDGKSITYEQFGETRVPLPPVHVQNAIATFLDGAISRIDALVAKKSRFIELLREKRQALITHAVTKGLDTGMPMKDSGVEWLGEVPAHWNVVPPSVLFTDSKERAHDGDQMLSATQKYGVIPLTEFEALEQRQVTKASTNFEMRKHVEVGDFVISMRSMDGGLERSHAAGSVRSSYSVLKAHPEVHGPYFGLLLKCTLFIQALRLTSNFIRDGQDLSFTHVKKVKLPLPDLVEQARIADFVGRASTRIDNLIAKTERSIELLREHRIALITAAVTGKIDLREAA
jgi:type I restriction enzyme S subunit